VVLVLTARVRPMRPLRSRGPLFAKESVGDTQNSLLHQPFDCMAYGAAEGPMLEARTAAG
jgi:hypothetical protein